MLKIIKDDDTDDMAMSMGMGIGTGFLYEYDTARLQLQWRPWHSLSFFLFFFRACLIQLTIEGFVQRRPVETEFR